MSRSPRASLRCASSSAFATASSRAGRPSASDIDIVQMFFSGGIGGKRWRGTRMCCSAARRAHANLDGVSLELAILRLPRIGGHRDRLVADVLDLVDRARLGDGPARGVAYCGSTPPDLHGFA